MPIIDIDNRKDWEDFFSEIKERTFLNSWNWGEFRKSLGNHIWRKGLTNSGKIVSLFLISKIRSKKGDFLLLAHSPSFQKIEKDDLTDVIEEVKLIAQKEKVSFIRIAPIFNPNDYSFLFSHLGFRRSPSLVFPTKSLELDISLSEDSILSDMRKGTRYLIKKGINNDEIKISITNSIKDLPIFYQLQKETALKQGFTPFTFKYMKKEFEIFSKENQAALFLASHKGDYIAGAFLIFWNKKAFYHHGASITNKVPASHLIQWEAIKEAKKRGCDFYNFWAIAPSDNSTHKWAGLTFFKKGFGGQELNYGETIDLPISKSYFLTYFIEKLRK